MITMLGTQNTGYVRQNLGWKLEGSSTCTPIDSTVAAAFEQPSVYVARANTVSFRATNGVEEFTVVLLCACVRARVCE